MEELWLRFIAIFVFDVAAVILIVILNWPAPDPRHGHAVPRVSSARRRPHPPTR